ncbi:uncharacterized protein LOC143301133 isoform X3 [Babylonia areolata]|uniref:uncharacterized protein LOC143301133 isoform X3 n=1 Tax=Babylonia areolata TaxID=304850 RepID=UPI003FD26ABB
MGRVYTYCVLLTLAVISGVCTNRQEDVCLLEHGSSLSKCEATQRDTEGSPLPVSEARCDFHRDLCRYTSRSCRGALGWTSTVHGYAQVKAVRNKPSVLESPLLDVSSPSCLTVISDIQHPAQMDVMFDTSGGLCLLETLPSASEPQTHHLHIPIGAGKVVFRAFTQGQDGGTVRIHFLSVDPDCCSIDWDEFMKNKGNTSRIPECSWQHVNQWKFFDNRVEGKNTRSQLTTPLLPPALSTSRPACLSFEFILPHNGDRSLRVSLVDETNSETLLWRIFRSRPSSFQHETGQIPIVSGSAFRVTFKAERKSVSPTGLIKVQFSRSTAMCEQHPDDAFNHEDSDTDTDSDTDSDTDPPSREGPSVAVIAGGGTAAVLVIAIVVCGVICWRRGKKRGIPDAAPTHPATPVREDRPLSNIYSEINDVPIGQLTPGGRQTRHDVSEGCVRAGRDDGHPQQDSYSHLTARGVDSNSHAASHNPHHKVNAYSPVGVQGTDNYSHIGALHPNQCQVQISDVYSHIPTRNPDQPKPQDPDVPSEHVHQGAEMSPGAAHGECVPPVLDPGVLSQKLRNPAEETLSDAYDHIGAASRKESTQVRDTAAPQAYSHVTFNTEGPYDVVQRDRQRPVVDSNYHSLEECS